MRKAVWTLNAGGDYAPEITTLTYPLLKQYAFKIKADFNIITQRKWPSWPVVYEKLQIFELGKNNDWNIYIDSDALIHPDMFDVTDHLGKDTVCHNAQDMAGNRWRYDRYFRRDGRHIGSCNWFAVASDWCIDLWHPLDITLEEAVGNIFPTVSELAPVAYAICPGGEPQKDDKGNPMLLPNSTSYARCPGGEFLRDEKGNCIRTPKEVITPGHLIDDYTLSRNIAKYGLKFTNIRSIKQRIGDQGDYFWHLYQIPIAEKVRLMKEVLDKWGIYLGKD